jgi:cysteinyl-tRNA synthetase
MAVNEATITTFTAGVERLDAFAREFSAARRVPPDEAAIEAFIERMEDDLDTPGAVAAAYDLVKEARASSGERAEALAAAVFEIFEAALGLPLRDEVAYLPSEARAKARARDEARAAKDWGRADQIRAELQADGWIVEDGPDGTTIR